MPLITEYPELISKRLQLGWPAVDPVTDYKAQDDPDLNSMRFVFVGKEWKRKGCVVLSIFLRAFA